MEATAKMQWISTAESAARAGVKVRTIERWAARGVVRAKRCPASRRLRIDAEDLARVIEGVPVAPELTPAATGC